MQWFFKYQNTKISLEDINHYFNGNPSVRIEFLFDEEEEIPSVFLEDYADESGKKFQIEAYNELKKIDERPQLPIYRLINDELEPKTIKTFPKIVDIIFVPSIRQLNDELKNTSNSTINKLVSKFVIERVHREDAKSKKYTKVKKAIEELSDYIGDGEYSAFGELKRSLDKHMLSYGNKELDFILKPPKPEELIKNSFEPYVNVNGNKLKVESQGMGYQRSLIFSLICNMAEIDSSTYNLLNLYLIEEPELFLHPNHQNHFRNKLIELSSKENNQLILTSHSPYFLNNIENKKYSQVKRIYLDEMGVSKLNEISTDEISVICDENGLLMANAKNKCRSNSWSKEELKEESKKISDEDALRYLLWVDPNRSNAFLSKKVLLVEGLTEKALFSFIFNHDEGEFKNDTRISELSVVDTVGKFHFYKFSNLLFKLGISTWIMYDTDNNKENKDDISHKLLNEYIEKMKTDRIIVDCLSIDPFLEKGIKLTTKKRNLPDISMYQQLVDNHNKCRESASYNDIITFVDGILDY